MAGTNLSLLQETDAPQPVIILSKPQLGENIGTSARAMLNCGFTQMRIIAPRDGWPNDKALKASSGADIIINNAQIFETLEDAIADLNVVFATTARPRDMVKPVKSPKLAVQDMVQQLKSDQKVGILFGPERTGLKNHDISLCDTVIEIPLNPAFSSLNLAQCILVLCYEFYQLQNQELFDRDNFYLRQQDKLAEKSEILNFFSRLEEKLDESGFLRIKEKKETMMTNIRNMFFKANLTEQEVNTLHGIVTSLSDPIQQDD